MTAYLTEKRGAQERSMEKTSSKVKAHGTFHKHPDKEAIQANILSLSMGIRWLQQLIEERMKDLEAGELRTFENSRLQKLPEFTKNSSIDVLLKTHGESEIEVLLLLLSFTSWFRPVSLLRLATLQTDSDVRYLEPGGLYKKHSSRFIPTLQTAVFLLAGADVTLQAYYQTVLSQHVLFREGILHLNGTQRLDSYPLEQLLEIDLAYYNYLIHGKKPRMDVSPDFPAALLETSKSPDDLVLKETTRRQLDMVMHYATVKERLYQREGVNDKLSPGYLALLYGPPGTGKTFSVAVLSKQLGIEAYRVDLSRIISKYIGETEKNLEKVFQRFEDKNCILMFDEADALFGKRTEVKDAKDRFANQEVAYLLQRVERFPGLVILATNYNQNLDAAFKRRILSSVYFAQPDTAEREILWQNSLPAYFQFEREDLPQYLAEKYSLTGANIANIMKLCCIQAEQKQENMLDKATIESFIYLEMSKEGTVTTRKQVSKQYR